MRCAPVFTMAFADAFAAGLALSASNEPAQAAQRMGSRAPMAGLSLARATVPPMKPRVVEGSAVSRPSSPTDWTG